MFSHIVVFWTDPAHPAHAEDLVAGAERLLKDIPGIVHFHVGKSVPSQRPVVEQSYQVALNITFTDRAAEHSYQTHPQHMEFVEKYVRGFVRRVVVYDFE